MKSIERRFQNLEAKFPLSSSFIVFAKAVMGERLRKDAIARWFPKLVVKGDYDSKDKIKLIDWLVACSNSSQHYEI